MSGMAGNSWKQVEQPKMACLEMTGNDWQWLKMALKGQKQLKMTENVLKLLKIARNDLKWLNWPDIDGNGWKLLELAENGWNTQKQLKMAGMNENGSTGWTGYGQKQLQIALMS